MNGIPLLVGVLGSSALLFILVTIFCTETGKAWRAACSTRRTLRRIQAIEGEIQDIEHYKSHPDDLLALVGAMVLRSMVRLALVVIFPSVYILVRADGLRASNVPAKSLVFIDAGAVVVLSVGITSTLIFIGSRIKGLRKILFAGDYKVLRLQEIERLRSRLPPPPRG